MTQHHPLVSMGVALGAVMLTAVCLVGCASPGAAVESTAGASTASPGATPTSTPEPATPTPVAIDPADVTTWVITAQGIGPIQRGEAYPAVFAGLPAFATAQRCPWVEELAKEGSGSMLVVHPEGAEEITGVWVNGRADTDGVLPASPATEAGIRLGSTLGELTAAYPELLTVNQVSAESQGYAVGDDADGHIDFLVEDDVVVLIGTQDAAGVPKEFCG